MALSDSLMQLKSKVTSAVNNFFYPKGEYPEDERVSGKKGGFGRKTPVNPPSYGENSYEGGPWQDQEEAPNPFGTGPYVRPVPQESNPNANTNPYTAPQGAQAPQAGWSGAGYKPPQQQAAPQQGMGQQQAADNLVYFPSQEAQRPLEAENAFAARVINARTVSDCYSAITQLRLGDMVVLVMDSITDPAEMRHYVDMLSGACYSLRATITKLSRHGAYLICPSRVRVYVDAATNQLNSSARQPQRPLQNPYGQVRGGAGMGYGQNPYQNPYPNYQQPYGQEQNRAPFEAGAASRSGGMDYYGRSAMPDAYGTADHLQPYANGYMPDGPVTMEEARAL